MQNNFNIGQKVTFLMEVGDLTSITVRLIGKIIERDERHITIYTCDNETPKGINDIKYYIASDEISERKVQVIK